MVTTPDTQAAARLRALWAAWEDKGTTGDAYARLLDEYPGRAGAYLADMEAMARWAVRALASGEGSNPDSPGIPGAPSS